MVHLGGERGSGSSAMKYVQQSCKTVPQTPQRQSYGSRRSLPNISSVLHPLASQATSFKRCVLRRQTAPFIN